MPETSNRGAVWVFEIDSSSDKGKEAVPQWREVSGPLQPKAIADEMSFGSYVTASRDGK